MVSHEPTPMSPDPSAPPTPRTVPTEPVLSDESVPASTGYRLAIDVLADSTFMVAKVPLVPDGPAMGMTRGSSMAQPGQAFPDVASAFKYAAELYQQNPVSSDEDAHMQAAFGSEDTSLGADVPTGYK